MHIIIVGGGTVGYYLAKKVLLKKHTVVIIESNPEICSKLANELDVLVVNGDGTDADVLSSAKIEKAEVIAAMTEKDEDNLVACQIAKKNFGIKKAIARVNNPQNEEIFRNLGIDNAVSYVSIVADLF